MKISNLPLPSTSVERSIRDWDIEWNTNDTALQVSRLQITLATLSSTLYPIMQSYHVIWSFIIVLIRPVFWNNPVQSHWHISLHCWIRILVKHKTGWCMLHYLNASVLHAKDIKGKDTYKRYWPCLLWTAWSRALDLQSRHGQDGSLNRTQWVKCERVNMFI